MEKTEASLKFPQNSRQNQTVRSSWRHLKNDSLVGLLLGGGWSLFLFGLSTTEHIDFCAQGHVRISHMCGLRGGRAANRVRWQKDVVEWPKGPVNCKSRAPI